MAKKTYKLVIGAKTQFVSLPDSYDSIAAEAGLEAVAAGDITVGDITPPRETLIKGGVLFQLSVGYVGGKRGRCVISVANLADRDKLVGKTFNGKEIKSVEIRTYSKLV